MIVLDQEQKDLLNKIFRGSVADAVAQLLNMREEYGDSDLAIAASQAIEMDGQSLLVKVTVSLEAIEDDEDEDDDDSSIS